MWLPVHACVNQTQGILVTIASFHIIRFTTIINTNDKSADSCIQFAIVNVSGFR